MERLTRYDVAEYNGVKMVVVESDLLPTDPAVVVIPLLSDYPAVKDLNPELVLDGQRWVLATRLIAAVRRSKLRLTVFLVFCLPLRLSLPEKLLARPQ